jgi:Leucine-rich repeat (LRR) protein
LLESFDDVSGTIYIHDLWIEFCKAETKLKDPRSIRLEEDQCTDLGESWKDLKRICFIDDGQINVNRLPRFPNVTVLKLVGEYGWRNKEPIVLDLRGMECLKSFESTSGSSFTYDNSNKDYGLGSLTNLEYLDWGGMAASRESIEKIGCLTKLQVLILMHFRGENFPDISNLTSLRVVDFSFSEKVQTITGLNSRLTNLQLLALWKCKVLRSCPGVGDLVALKELDLSFCKKLKKLPSYLGKLSNLRKLHLDGCKSLRSISGLSDLVSLEELKGEDCSSLEGLPDMRKLTMLRNLLMDINTPVSKVPGFQGLISLEILFADFSFLEEWPDLGKLSLLRDVNIEGWSGPGLSSMANLELLEVLTVFSCEEVDVLPDLQNLKRLRSLSLQSSNFKDLAALCNLTSLHILQIQECRMLESLPDMHMLTNMRTLDVIFCDNLKRLPDMHMLTNMRALDVSYCDNLKRLPDAHFPATLRTLKIKQFKNWERRDNFWRNCWPGVSNLTLLESLDVEGFASMKNFPNVSRLTCLRSLTLTSGGYKNVHVIKDLCQLEILRCFDLREIVEIPDLGNFPRLKELKLRGCVALKSVTTREPLVALEKINLSCCWSLKEMPDLSSFPRLEGLSLLYCEELMKLTSREQLHSLKRVRLQGCKSLDVVPDYLSSCIQNNMALSSRGIWEEDMRDFASSDYDSPESSMSESSDTSDEIWDDSDGTSDASSGTLDAFDTISDA